MNKLPNKNLLSIKEAAKLLNVSIDTIRRWEKSGRISGVRTAGGHRRYTLENIERAKNKTNVPLDASPVSFNYEDIPFTVPQDMNRVLDPGPLLNDSQKNVIKFMSFCFFSALAAFLLVKANISTEYVKAYKSELVSIFPIPSVLKSVLGSSVSQFPDESTEIIAQSNESSKVLAAAIDKTLPVVNINIQSSFKEVAEFVKGLNSLDVSTGTLTATGAATLSGGVTITGATTLGATTTTTLGSTGNATFGNITRVNGVTYSFPTTQGTATTFLKNDGTGTLTWGSLSSPSNLTDLSGTLGFSQGGTNNTTAYTSGSIIFSNGTKLTESNSSLFWDTTNNRLGLGTTTPTSTLSVGGSSQFAVNSTGNITKINGVTYSFPSLQGASSTILTNDGAGTLTWGTASTNVSSATGVLPIANGGTNNSTAYTAGSVVFSDGTKLTQDNAQFFWNDTLHQLRIGSGGAVVPSVNLGSDLGTSSLRWNNIYVGTVNSNSTLSTTGQALFTYSPTDTTYGQSSVQINPTTAPANSFMLGIGLAGAQTAGIDVEGDLTLGYSGGAGTSAPNNANPLSLYNHGSTNIALIDTSGDLRLGSAGVTANTGVLNITGAFTGKALAILNETGDQALFTASSSGTPKFVIDHNGQVGIGLTPNTPLDVAITFPYQKAIAITYSGSTLVNNSILVVTDTSTLISAAKLQSSCQDLRFTDSDNSTQLQYYIESGCNTTNTQIWVQIPSIPNGGKTIYMHYGNTSAPAATKTLPAQNFIAPFNATCPAGWTSVSAINTSTRFVRGNTAYGATGGSTTPTHTVSGTTGTSGAANRDTATANSAAANVTHTHTLGSTTTSAPSNGQPPFVDTVYCSFNGSVIPNTVPTSFIGMFDTVPSGWTRDATYDTNFLRGNTTAGGVGGSATHTHTFTGTTGAPSATLTNNNGADVRPDTVHTHTFTAVSTDAASSLPSYRDMLIAKPNATSSLAAGLVISFDAANTPPLGWTQYTNLNGKFPRGNTTSGGTGGADTHSHTFSVTSGVESSSASAGGGAGGGATVAAKSHTHVLAGTSSTDSGLPPYIEVVYYQRNTDATTNSVGSETSTTGPERDLVVGSNGYTGVGQISPLWKLQVTDYRESSASALIENTANLSLFNPTGLIVRLGNDSTNPDTGDRFINFMKGDSTIVGKIQGNGGTGSVNYATAGTDFAEYFKKDDPLELLQAGDAVCIGTNGITKCTPQNSNKVVGIISDQAGFTGGIQHEDDPAYAIVGLSGQLNVKVASSSADIKTGDLLTASTEPGKATKALIKGGFYLAKALEDWDPTLGKDRVRVLIQSGYYDSPFLSLDGTGNIPATSSSTLDPSVLGSLPTATSSGTLNSSSPLDASASAALTQTITALADRIQKLEADDVVLKNQITISGGSSVLGVATDSATFTSLSVLKNAILGDTVVNGKLSIGILSLDNVNGSLDAIGTLKLQSLALGPIEFEDGNVVIDKDGNVNLKKGRIVGNDTFRGSIVIKAGQTSVDVTATWDTPPKSITVSPSYVTSFGVTKLTKDGFTVEVDKTPTKDETLYWGAIW